jgi:GntR family transcriptional regulator
VAPLRDNLRGLIENLLSMGLRTSVRVRSARGTRFSDLTAFSPEAVGRRFARADLAEAAPLLLLEARDVCIVRAKQTISAKRADAEVARLLGVAFGAALLWVRRQVFDPSGRIIEALEALHRPDMCEYPIGLARCGALLRPCRDDRA